jgi:hypothetical protein
MNDDEKREIAEKFIKIISERLEISEDRITISAIFSNNHVLARVILRDAKFVDAFENKLIMYTQYDEIDV